MSETVNEINKIYLDRPLEISDVNMTTLLFSDSLLCPKTSYTITDNMLFVKDQPQYDLDLFQFVDSSRYYEFLVNLRERNTKVSGIDRYGNTLKNLSQPVLVFVNGYKLSSSEYEIDIENNIITIKASYTNKVMSNVIVYTSADIVYEGNVEDDFSWNSELNQFVLKDYTLERYIFFKNGELISPDKIQKIGNYIRLNTVIKHGIDFVEYYRMSKDCYALTFTPSFGYLTYGPKDDRGTTIQNPYNCVVTFDNIARLVIDDIRPGFFIHEKNGDGCVIIVDDDFEGRSVKCLVVTKFNKKSLQSSEYYLTVPDAPSIIKYVSEYDLNGLLFKELLTSFQKVLLNETYDSIQRLKNIRNINKVDSSNINALINFLGLQINVTNLNLEKKHNLVEELRSFYNTVGTRASYNFYNAFRDDGKIINIEQLFTPIKSTKKPDKKSYFFNKEWGKLIEVFQTVVPDEFRKSYAYTWSLHFENGTLPVVIRKDSFTPEWNFDCFENVVDSRLNGCYYLKSKKTWVNTIANDGTDWMEWLNTSNQNQGNMAYSTATAWGWDEGHLINRHPSVHTYKFQFTIENGVFSVRDTYKNVNLGSWTFCTTQEERSEGSNKDDVSRYVDFRTAEELGAEYHQRYITDTLDFGQVSELAINNVNLANTPRFEGVLRYSNYPVLTEGVIDRYHPAVPFPVLMEDKITLSLTINSSIRTANITKDNNYECEIDENTGNIILLRHIGTASNVVVPETISYQTREVANISVDPINLRVELYNSENKRMKVFSYDENTNTFEYLIDEGETYSYKILDKKRNLLYENTLSTGDQTISMFLPLINDYTTDPQQGPNKPSIDCGYIREDPVDFYDFGKVSEQLSGHWVSWYTLDRKNLWYPTNHVDVSVEIPVTMDYETFMNIFKDAFYEIASAVLYIHQITQIYMFGDPNNNGSTEIQPMSLLTSQVYETEEQCFTNDHEFLPYKKAVSNKPLELVSYMFRNPTYEFQNDGTLKASVELYKNFGRDEYLYKTTGEEKDIEWTDVITGYLPCKQLTYTDWTSQQQTSNQTTGDVHWNKLSNLPGLTVTCVPNQTKTDWLYAIVINYDVKEEGYIVSKNLQTVTKVAETSDIKMLQTVVDGKINYVRPNSLFYENNSWHLSYVTLDTEFSVYEWKLASLDDEDPHAGKENLKAGIAEFTLSDAADMNWNLGRTNEVIINHKVEVEDSSTMSIYVDTDTPLYSKVNYIFDINNAPYTDTYSYSHNNTTWSCDLVKYNVYNTVQLENGSETNCAIMLLPTNIVYYDNNTKMRFNFQDIDYVFTKATPELVPYEETEDSTFYKYTNHLLSIIDNSTLKFDTYGTLVSSKEIVLKNVDYVVLKYRWTSGRDLDSWTYITNMTGEVASSINNIKVGFGTGNTYVPNPSNYLLYWGGDNTGTGEENILLDIKKLKQDYLQYTPEELNIEMFACWYTKVSQTQPVIEVTGYQGGTMSKSGYQFVNSGGVMVAQQTIQAVNMSTTTTHEYKSVANVKYNKAQDTFMLTVTDRYEETTPDLNEVANLLGE